ncbi:MAG: hypothetical protein GC190_17855 [Alphaproteobacteria bacterium]|nr:hypothetical protein [Alphaproteobacteria bacterium]
MKALAVAAVLVLALGACKPEKNPPTGDTSGPTATAPTQAEACDRLLKNDKGEYSAGKCVCSEGADASWTCRLGD